MMDGDQCYKVCNVPGKGGVGVVASRDLSSGTLVIVEHPLLVLDPPTDRKTLMKTLGCDWFGLRFRE